jgi:hypothetical protein
MTADRCEFKTCMFKDVLLAGGTNTVVATGNYGGQAVSDEVTWNFDNDGIYIAAGALETGLQSSDGKHFGSDNFFVHLTNSCTGTSAVTDFATRSHWRMAPTP